MPGKMTTRAFVLLLCWVGAVWVVGCGGNISNNKFHQGLGALEGRFVLPDGQPAAYAHIQIVNLPQLQATTDADGRFALRDIPAGKRELLVRHRQHGKRLTTWVVGGKSISLETSEGTLVMMGAISGVIQAQPRFGAKGIQISLRGTSLRVSTKNHEGEFSLQNVPAGCYIMQVETPYFVTQKIQDLCIEANERKLLPTPVQLQPAIPCGGQASSACGDGALCHEGACVAESGGEVLLQESAQHTLGTILLNEKRKETIKLLKNDGPGPLRIEKIQLKQVNQIFWLSPPALPVVLQSQQVLSLEVHIAGAQLGIQQAVLEVETNDPQKPRVQVVLQAKVQGYTSNCLKPSFEELQLGTLAFGKSHRFLLPLFNRCETAQTVTLPDDYADYFPKDAGFTAIQREATVPPGRAIELEFELHPLIYGAVYGILQIRANKELLRVPVRSFVAPLEGTSPALQISPHPLSFGVLPPGASKTLWLHLRFAKVPDRKALAAVSAKLLAMLGERANDAFSPGASLQARSTSENNRDFYLPVRYQAPDADGTQRAWLRLDGLPGLQGSATLIELNAQVSSAASAQLPANLHVGATTGCSSAPVPIILENPGKQPIEVNALSLPSWSQEDFALEHPSLPLVVPAAKDGKASRVEIGKVRFSPTQKLMRAYGQLEVSLRVAGQALTPQVISLQASSGIPYQDFYTQADGKRVEVLFVIDHHADLLPLMNATFLSLLSHLQKQQVEYRLLFVQKQGVVGTISSDSRDPSNLMTRLLSKSKDPSHQGLEAIYRALQQRSTRRQVATLAVIVASEDDQSPFDVGRYLSFGQTAPVAVFGALALGACGGALPRYQDAIQQGHGLALDLCSAKQADWTWWGEKLQRFASGTRRSFVLSHKAVNTEIALSIDGRRIPETAWTYNDDLQQLTLHSKVSLKAGEKLQVSYYTACKK